MNRHHGWLLPLAAILLAGATLGLFRAQTNSKPRYPDEDIGVDTLEARKQAQIATEKQFKVFIIGSEEARLRAGLRPPPNLPVHVSWRQLPRRLSDAMRREKELNRAVEQVRTRRRVEAQAACDTHPSPAISSSVPRGVVRLEIVQQTRKVDTPWMAYTISKQENCSLKNDGEVNLTVEAEPCSPERSHL
jgi:hypothetical protein